MDFLSVCPNWPWGPHSLRSSRCRGLFPGGKADGAWSWPLTPIYCRG